MEELAQLFEQMMELAGIGLEAVQGAMGGGEGGAPAEGAPAEGAPPAEGEEPPAGPPMG